MKAKEWKYIKTAISGNCELFGVNIFEYKWEYTGENTIVEEPLYHQRLDACIFTVSVKGKMYKFAAVEVSNCVWTFYV